MEIEDLVEPKAVLAHLKATSKKQALQDMSTKAANVTGIDERRIFDTILERERLGTTGVGQGIAIPHGKMQELKGLYGIFARLNEPVDFEAVDNQPVDLIFMLLAPESAGADHLKALAKVSRLLRDNETCSKLRGAEDRDAIYAVLTHVNGE